jgi:DNA-binding GntR family transcriptional regulator
MFDGLSLRKTAERYGCSVYRVRKAMEKLHTLSRIERSKGA